MQIFVQFPAAFVQFPAAFVQFPGVVVWFPVVPHGGCAVPGGRCAVPGAAKVPSKVPVKGAEIAQSAKIAPLTARMTKLKRK